MIEEMVKRGESAFGNENQGWQRSELDADLLYTTYRTLTS